MKSKRKSYVQLLEELSELEDRLEDTGRVLRGQELTFRDRIVELESQLSAARANSEDLRKRCDELEPDGVVARRLTRKVDAIKLLLEGE